MNINSKVQNLCLPNTVDIEINGVCNLDCPWCWGPVHDPTIETLTNEDWMRIISLLYEYGTRSIIITGGEPLLRKNLGNVLEYIKSKNMRVTLSTNGILLKSLIPILHLIDDIGLPLDGNDHESNSKMRISPNKTRHIDHVLDTIRYVQTNHPKIRLTVRTVVSAKNYEHVSAIGKTLISADIDPKKLRWKLYQVSPEGPRHDTTVKDGWLISNALFQEVSKRILAENPEYPKISFMAVEKSIKRYLLLDPSGDGFVLGSDCDDHPTQIPVGNVMHGFDSFLEDLNLHRYFPSDETHGV